MFSAETVTSRWPTPFLWTLSSDTGLERMDRNRESHSFFAVARGRPREGVMMDDSQ